MVDRDIPQIGVDIYTPDFQTIARGFGCRARAGREPAPICASSCAQAHRRHGPTVIEIDDAAALRWWRGR